MRNILLLLTFSASLFGQTANCGFTPATITSNTPTAGFQNKIALPNGTPCVAFIVTYQTSGATAVVVQIEGSAADSTGAQTGAWTPLTAETGSANPANGTASGSMVVCCDYWPWLRINPTTFTGTSQKMYVRVNGYISTQAAKGAGGGGGGGITQLTGDVTAGPGSGSQAATGVKSANLKGGVLGDVPYQNAPDTTLFVPPQTAAVQKFLSQTGDGVNGAPPSWQIVPTQSSLAYYWTDTASDVATYLQQTVAPFSPKTTLTTGSLTAGTHTIRNFATNAGVPALTEIPAGQFSVHFHASRTGGSANVTVQVQVWEVSATGVDIGLIGTTEATSPALTTGELEYNIAFARANPYTMTSTASRLVSRVQAVVVSGTQTVNLFVGGTADSHLTLPGPTIDVTNFVPYNGAAFDLDLGTHSYSGFGASPVCSAASGSTTAYTCTTASSFVPAAGRTILFCPDLANTAASTLKVNAQSGTPPLKKQQGQAALVANDLRASPACVLAEFDGTNWDLQGQSGNAPAGGATIPVTTNALKGDGAGNAAAVPGSASDCVHVDGGSGACSSGGGGALILVEQHTASNSAELDFTTCISATYDTYQIEMQPLIPATNSVGLIVQVSTDGGSTYDTASHYQWASWRFFPTGSNAGGGTADTSWGITGSNEVSNTATLGGVVGWFKIYNPAATGSIYPRFVGEAMYQISGAPTNVLPNVFGANYAQTTAMNAFRLLFTSGNIASGTVRCYGIAH